MVKKLSTLVVIAALAVGGFFLLHKRVLWLDYFDGRIIERVEDQVATVTRGANQSISYYFFDVETDDGRNVRAPVDQLVYFRAREGMRVHKAPFTSTVSLTGN